MDKDRTWYLMGKKVAGEATAAEAAELERLLRETPDVRYTMEVLSSVWKLAEKPEDQAMAEMAFRHQWSKLESETAHQVQAVAPPDLYRWKRALLTIAAMFFFIGTLWYMVNRQSTKVVAQAELVTRKGMHSKLQLPDGSLVWLNAGSKLTYAKEADATHVREVTLSGEGYFDIATQPGKPFIIHTSDMEVKVLGTRVNVRAYPEDATLEATLIAGRVSVQLNGHVAEAVYLQPNQKLTVAASLPQGGSNITPVYHVSVVRPVAVNNKNVTAETSWVSNTLVFQDEPFNAVAAKMGRWYDRSFSFADDRTAAYHFTGAFEDEPLEQALKAMQCIHPFHYKLTDTTVFIY